MPILARMSGISRIPPSSAVAPPLPSSPAELRDKTPRGVSVGDAPKAAEQFRRPFVTTTDSGPSGVVALRAALAVKPPVEAAFEALRHSDVAALTAWIAAGGDVDGYDASGMRLVQLAAVRGDLDALRELIGARARVDLPHVKSGAQALHFAASGGSAEAVRMVVAAGGSLEAIWPMNGHTPLVEAAFKNNVEAALALLDAGADPTKTSIRGVGIMDFALRNPSVNAPLIKRLDALFARHPGSIVRTDAPVHDIDTAAKADSVRRIFDAVATRDAELQPAPRMDQAFLDFLAAADRGDVDALRSAIAKDPAVVNQRGGRLGTTALILATVAGRTDVARLLLERGADPNLTEIHPMAVHPLFKAAVFGRDAIAQLLVNAGARIDDQGLANGMTPLHDAVLQGRAGMVRILLAAHARTDIEDYTGATAAQFARDRGSDEVRAVFREYGRI